MQIYIYINIYMDVYTENSLIVLRNLGFKRISKAKSVKFWSCKIQTVFQKKHFGGELPYVHTYI